MKDDDKLAGTEIYEYSEDGWYITDHFYRYPANHLQNNTAICFDNTDGLIYFCEEHKSIKAAVCNENKHIIGISEEFPVVCKDKYAVVTSAELNAEDYTLNREGIEGRNFIFCEDEETTALLLWLLFTFICNISLFATFIFYAVKKQQLTRKSVIMRCVLLSIGEVGLRGVQIVNHVVPYLNVHDKKLDLKPTIMEYPWIAGWIMLVIYLKLVGTKDSAEKTPEQDTEEEQH